MKPLPLVALGGITGSLLRWQLIEALPSLSLGVFIVNQLGVLIAGIVAYRVSATQSGGASATNQVHPWVAMYDGWAPTLVQSACTTTIEPRPWGSATRMAETKTSQRATKARAYTD